MTLGPRRRLAYLAPGEAMGTAEGFVVICLCAEWCGTCRDYQPGFSVMAADFPGVRFAWLDIEEQADDLTGRDGEREPVAWAPHRRHRDGPAS